MKVRGDRRTALLRGFAACRDVTPCLWAVVAEVSKERVVFVFKVTGLIIYYTAEKGLSGGAVG